MKAIKVNNVCKKFKIYHDKGNSLKEKVLFKNRNYYEERTVLDNISFEVEKGEVLGLIGENGCGKSTLLKLMTKIMYPDSGNIEMSGRISSLIELGAGFHPDMSGRENIYTNASIFGLTKKEIDQRIGKIIKFSELEEFIDNPVRTYSSGMYMRLAFSVAINVDADILLIDEILAVGDANFQAKCFECLRGMKAAGTTIVIVTHDAGTIESFCNKAVWINKGRVMVYDVAHKAVDAYLAHMNNKRMKALEEESKTPNVTINTSEEEINRNDDEINTENITDVEVNYNGNNFGLKYVTVEKVILRNKQEQEIKVLKGGEAISIDIHYKVNKPLDEYVFGMGFHKLDGECLMGSNTQLDRIKIEDIKPEGIVRFKIERLPLLTGQYILNIAIVDCNHVPMDFYRSYCEFNVVTDDRSVGYISVEHSWEVI